MTYSKNTWADGDVITAEKLNNMEDGIEGANGGGVFPLMVTLNEETHYFDKTYGEIYNAFLSGVPIWIVNENYYYPIERFQIYPEDGEQQMQISITYEGNTLMADTLDNYPFLYEE